MTLPIDPKRATKAQINYIEILCNDIGIRGRFERNANIKDKINREIKFLDELTTSEASEVIDYLRRMKYGEEE